MKKFYLFFCLILTGIISHAQISKGTVILGGNLEYDQQSEATNTFPGQSSYKTTGLTISPSFGRAIKDNLVLGFDVLYGHGTNSNDPNFNSENSNSFGAGLFLRRYKPLGNGFYLFGESRLSGNYAHANTTNNSGGVNVAVSDVTNTFALSLQFVPGIAYALDRRWQLEISLPYFFAVNYSHAKQTVDYTGQSREELTDNNFSAASTLTGSNTVSIGIRYLISGAGTH